MTYFFQKSDGEIFDCTTETADFYVKNQGKEEIPKLIGASDGKTYQKIFNEEMKKTKLDRDVLSRVVSNLWSEVEGIEKGLEKETNQDIIRQKLEQKEIKYEDYLLKEKELNAIQEKASDKAWKAEIEVAKQNKEIPPDTSYTFYDKGGEVYTENAKQTMRNIGL